MDASVISMWIFLGILAIPFVLVLRILWNLGTRIGNKDK